MILAIKKIKALFPSVLIAADVCLCEYTSHGHCGVLDAEGLIDQEKSVKRYVISYLILSWRYLLSCAQRGMEGSPTFRSEPLTCVS